MGLVVLVMLFPQSLWNAVMFECLKIGYWNSDGKFLSICLLHDWFRTYWQHNMRGLQRRGTSKGWYFKGVIFHRGDISNEWYLKVVIFQRGDISKKLYFKGVIFERGWYFKEVIFQRVAVSKGCSWHREDCYYQALAFQAGTTENVSLSLSWGRSWKPIFHISEQYL